MVGALGHRATEFSVDRQVVLQEWHLLHEEPVRTVHHLLGDGLHTDLPGDKSGVGKELAVDVGVGKS